MLTALSGGDEGPYGSENVSGKFAALPERDCNWRGTRGRPLRSNGASLVFQSHLVRGVKELAACRHGNRRGRPGRTRRRFKCTGGVPLTNRRGTVAGLAPKRLAWPSPP